MAEPELGQSPRRRSRALSVSLPWRSQSGCGAAWRIESAPALGWVPLARWSEHLVLAAYSQVTGSRLGPGPLARARSSGRYLAGAM